MRLPTRAPSRVFRGPGYLPPVVRRPVTPYSPNSPSRRFIGRDGAVFEPLPVLDMAGPRWSTRRVLPPFQGPQLSAENPSHPAPRWTESSFGGKTVYQRSSLINPNTVDAKGLTNLQRMGLGRPPLGDDGLPINLHHTIQMNAGPVVELTTTMHRQWSRILHINPSSIPSGINRPAFDAWRSSYWQNRANDFKPPPTQGGAK
jgi:hypothetical protein